MAFEVVFKDSVKLDGRVVFVVSVVAKLELSEAAVKFDVDEVVVEVERGTIVVESLDDDGEVVSATTDEEVGDDVVVTFWLAEELTS